MYFSNIIWKGSGDNESLACKCWGNWSKLEQTDLGGQMTPMVGHWCILKRVKDCLKSCILYHKSRNLSLVFCC